MRRSGGSAGNLTWVPLQAQQRCADWKAGGRGTPKEPLWTFPSLLLASPERAELGLEVALAELGKQRP